LYQLDVERLNEQIAQVRGWLPVSSFLVIDREGWVLTDGIFANEHYGERRTGPRFFGATGDLLLTRRGEETEVYFAIASGGVTVGWGIVIMREGFF
jgi:hypothetical protein